MNSLSISKVISVLVFSLALISPLAQARMAGHYNTLREGRGNLNLFDSGSTPSAQGSSIQLGAQKPTATDVSGVNNVVAGILGTPRGAKETGEGFFAAVKQSGATGIGADTPVTPVKPGNIEQGGDAGEAATTGAAGGTKG